MSSPNQIKKELYDLCKEAIIKRIESIKRRLADLEEARNNETKSSAGDKFETGRAMIQIEEDKSKNQLMEASLVKAELVKIDFKSEKAIIGNGSLVYTNKGVYFISIGIGKVVLDDQMYYCISEKSPIAVILKHKSIGDIFTFNDIKFEVLNIV